MQNRQPKSPLWGFFFLHFFRQNKTNAFFRQSSGKKQRMSDFSVTIAKNAKKTDKKTEFLWKRQNLKKDIKKAPVLLFFIQTGAFLI